MEAFVTALVVLVLSWVGFMALALCLSMATDIWKKRKDVVGLAVQVPSVLVLALAALWGLWSLWQWALS